MSTTIDSLQIEIQSNSTNAARSIKELAASLGELKTSGKVTTAVKNLNNLSQALRTFTNVPSAASKVSTLANSLEKLKSVGSVGGVGNSLTKLSASLKGLDSVNVGNVAPQIQKIADAVAPLSAIKAGGLNTMVNGLSKIGKVTQDLDDDKIDAFAERIEKLTDKLTPLSTKMTTIKSGLSAINSNARSAGSSVKSMGDNVNGASINLSSFIYTIQEVVQWLQQAIESFKKTVEQSIEWDGIAARFGRGFGAQAQETYDWIQRLNEEMGINVQQFMQYSSIYANMLQGFGVTTKDANTMALGYTELTYDIWAGYNDIYKSFAEASEAVKSAIAGEVEPIRRAGFTIVETQLEQTAANYGLSVSLHDATEAQKSYLRYLTLVDQAHAQNLVGTYAKELSTAEGLMRTFSQQTKSLSQAFGSLFLPILVKIMPYLQAFVELLIDGVKAIAALFGITIQGVDWSGYESGLGGVTEGTDDLTDSAEDATKAIKELKNASLGIDELNVISPPTSSANSGGGSGGGGNGFGDLDVDSLWDESIFKNIGEQVDKIKQKLEDWLPVIATIGSALGTLTVMSLISSIGNAISKMSVLNKLISSVFIVTVEALLVFAFADNYLESGNLLYLIGEALVTATAGYLMFKAWGPTGATLALGISILAQIAAIKMSLADGTISLSSPNLWIQAITTALTGAIGGAIIASKTGFFAREGFVIGLAASISLTMTAINMGAIESGEIDTDSFESWIMQAVSVAGAGMTGLTIGKAISSTGGKTGLLIGVTVGLVLNLASVVGAKGEDFGNNISDWINGILTAGALAGLGAKLAPLVKSGLETAYLKALYAVDWGKGLLSSIGTSVTAAAPGLTSVLSNPITWAIAGIVAGIPTMFVSIYDACVDGIDWLNGLLVPAGATAAGAGIGAIIGALGGPIGAGVGALIGLVVGLIADGIILISQKWDDIKKWFEDLPTKISDWWEEDIEPFFTEDIPTFFTETIPEWGSTISYEIGYALGSGTRAVVDWFSEDVKPFFTETIPNFFTVTIPTWGKNIAKSISNAFSKATKAIKEWWNKSVVPFFTKTIPKFFKEDLPQFFKDLPEKFAEIGSNIIEGIWSGISTAWNWLKTTIGGWIESFIQGFKDGFGIKSPAKKFIEIGKQILAGLLEPLNVFSIAERVKAMWESAKEWWNEKKGVLKTYTPDIGSIKDKVSTAWSNAKIWWDEKKGTLKTYTPSIGSIRDKLSSAWSSAKTWWNEKKGSLKSYTPSIGSITSKISSAWSSAKTWWNNKKGELKKYTPKFGSIVDSIKSAWASAKKWWDTQKAELKAKLNIQVPKIKIQWDSVTAFGKKFKYPTGFDLAFAANGGVFDAGSLIWAGERGAEVVANAGGGKTGVMNVQQMADAVYDGVYAAVIAANRASGNSEGQVVKVYLDGKDITRSVEKTQRERGASIMGSQVYNY